MSVSIMKRLTVLAYRHDAEAILRRLMKKRCVDLQNAPVGDRALSQNALDCTEQRGEAEETLALIRRVLPILAPYSTRKRGLRRYVHRVDRLEFVKDGRDRQARHTLALTKELTDEKDALQRERTECETQIEALVPWLDYDAPLCENETKYTRRYLGSYPPKTDMDAVQEELKKLCVLAEPIPSDDEAHYMALTVHRMDERELDKHLATRGFVKVAFPQVDLRAASATERAEARVEEIRARLDEIEDKLRDMAEFLDDIEILSDIEETTLRVCTMKQKLITTKNCVILEGWVPEKKCEEVLQTLSSFECAAELSDPEEGEDVPVQLSNNKFAETFEWVIGMYSYPKYGTFDPTFIMSIFYFLVFGMMFADVGYGLLLVLCCFGGVKLLNPRDGMKQMLIMFGYCGISCTIMGVLFGGWFGNLPTAVADSFGLAMPEALRAFFTNGLILNPIDSSTGFLAISLAVGQLHLMAGMAVNMYITVKAGKVAEGLCSTIPYWVLFIGIDLMSPGMLWKMIDPVGAIENQALIAQLVGIGKYVAIVGVVGILLLKGIGQGSFKGWLVKGLGGLYSLISYASDLLSYSRILALGLVAGVISQVINMMTGLGASGPVGFVFMLVVMILGHVLNIAINLLGTFVHAARLQYIEFFGKFYEDGGTPFRPAVPAEQYSEDIGLSVDEVTYVDGNKTEQ